MLRLTPRTITAAILLFFAFFLGVQHFSFSVLLRGGGESEIQVHDTIEAVFPFLPWLERMDYDFHLRSQKPLSPHSDVMVVEVNEKSIQELGQFPFSRDVYKQFLERLEAAGAKVVAFDILFPEAQLGQSITELRKLRAEIIAREGAQSFAAKLVEQKLKNISGDDEFQEGLRNAKMAVILGYGFADKAASRSGVRNIDSTQVERLTKYGLRRIQVTDNALIYSADDRIPVIPHQDLIDALNEKSSLGLFIPDHDSDSVIRRAATISLYRGAVLPSLAVQATAAYLNTRVALVGGDHFSLQDEAQKGSFYLPITSFGSTYLRYYGQDRVFPYREFVDVVKGTSDFRPEEFKGKIVFVGATAVGLKDIRANPFSQDYPGVEVHATMASNILQKHFIEKDSRYFFFGYSFLLLLGLLAASLVYRFSPLWAALITCVAIVVLQLVVQKAFFDQGVVVPSFLPSLSAFTVLFAGLLYRYFNEEKEKKMVRTAFSRYVSSTIVEEILRDQSKLRLGGQKRELTVMFCDLVGFTKLSEQMDAAFVTQLLNEYFTRMTRIILKNRGTLDKYMGDAIMCFWGAPLEIPEHASLACTTAIEMMEELDRINLEWKQKHGIQIGIRIGIHTGDMAVGNMGSEQVFSYTVMGDNVNLCSRLEGVNNVYGTRAIVSQATAVRAGTNFLYRPLDTVRVKGKEEAVAILELVARKESETAHHDWMHAFASGLQSYRKGEWDLAKAAFGTCLQLRPEDQPSKVFLERIESLRSTTKDEWDGVWKLHSK